MNVLGVILARAGSKGLSGKCVRPVLGRAMIEYTFDHAVASRSLTHIVLSTDSQPAKTLARQRGLTVVDRPAELATDAATVDAAARHAVEAWEHRHGGRADIVVLLYGNIPLRAPGLIDRAVGHLIATGADSVRSVAPVSKHHPDWLHRLDGDRMVQFRRNSIYRRQDLETLFYHDGAVAVVTRAALFGALETPDDHQAFLGEDRRAIVQAPGDAVDVDEPRDLVIAEALLAARGIDGTPSAARRDGPCVGVVAIGDRVVGAGQRTLLICEAGVNHNGCVDTALRMIDAAAEAGADAVKFQMFRASELVVDAAPTAAYQRARGAGGSQREMLSRLELSEAEFTRLRDRCAEVGVMFLATPFSVADVGRLVGLGVAAIKVASTDLTNAPLLDAIAHTRLPVILSTGASTAEEMRQAVVCLRDRGAVDRLILLHCVSRYPVPGEEANLRAIATLEESFRVPCGLSDHTTSTETGAWAVAVGACVLEKHFTLDRDAAGPDHAMSLMPEPLRAYIRRVREVEACLGDGALGLTAGEIDVRRVASRSVVACADIPRGTVLAPRHLTLKRPGTGIDPAGLDGLIGKETRVDIAGNTMLSWDMVR